MKVIYGVLLAVLVLAAYVCAETDPSNADLELEHGIRAKRWGYGGYGGYGGWGGGYRRGWYGGYGGWGRRWGWGGGYGGYGYGGYGWGR
ncbi:hypothetical protein L596_017546 [Steinernema carpocapsae]|uniref:Uncharacterized protein n=1 Tax=Steinernema carpocapsae TaxID=34508 RepID=A0A4V6A1S0_STECR|nr:hypothetical protein L596_017546 [Steinernema carpocapsae]